MILWRNIENNPFYHFDSNPRFPPFLLYVRWKSGVTFVRRSFRDAYLFYNNGTFSKVAFVLILGTNIRRAFKGPLVLWVFKCCCLELLYIIRSFFALFLVDFDQTYNKKVSFNQIAIMTFNIW